MHEDSDDDVMNVVQPNDNECNARCSRCPFMYDYESTGVNEFEREKRTFRMDLRGESRVPSDGKGEVGL